MSTRIHTRNTLLLVVFLMFITCAHSQPVKVYNFDSTTYGKVHLIQGNYGVTGRNPTLDCSGLIYPRESNTQYLYASGLWVGGMLRASFPDTTPRYVFPTYDVTSGTGWAIPGELKNGREIRQDLAEQYYVKRRIHNGIEELSCAFHMGDTMRYNGAARSRIPGMSDLQFYQRIYAFNYEPLTSTIIGQVDIVNTGQNDILGFTVGWVFDTDIGNKNDPSQAAINDVGVIANVNNSKLCVSAHDEKQATAGELIFTVLDTPNDVKPMSIPGMLDMNTTFGHYDRYNLMTSGWLFLDIPGDFGFLYVVQPIHEFLSGDTLRYTYTIMMMSAETRQELLAQGGEEPFLKFYEDAATAAREAIVDLPTHVNETELRANTVSIFPQPASMEWSVQCAVQGKWDVSIVATSGQQVFIGTTTEDGQLAGPSLPSGVYQVIFKQGANCIARPLVIVK